MKLSTAKTLAGKVLHASRKAGRLGAQYRHPRCRIIIAPKDLTEIIPVSHLKDTDLLITQYRRQLIEDAGVIKMDFLGLKTLTIIKECAAADQAESRR